MLHEKTIDANRLGFILDNMPKAVRPNREEIAIAVYLGETCHSTLDMNLPIQLYYNFLYSCGLNVNWLFSTIGSPVIPDNEFHAAKILRVSLVEYVKAIMKTNV